MEDEDPDPLVRLVYQVYGSNPVYTAMYDDGEHEDFLAGDGCYGCILPPFQLNETLSWQVSAIDNLSQSTYLPCVPVVIEFHASADPQLFINEFMANNDMTLADEFGEYEDWVEIYNADDEPVWLGDKYLSDDFSDPGKWQLPDFTMQPGTFLLIWADEDPGQGPFHTNYKLDNNGEELAVFDNETTGYFLIDSISFGEQDDDISFGRQEDGELPWVYFDHPTPGFGNQTYGMPEPSQDHVIFYPNPVTGNVIHFNEPFTGRLIDITGRLVWNGTETKEINIGYLPDGFYLLSDQTGRMAKVIIDR